jgi:hypothetical protein
VSVSYSFAGTFVTLLSGAQLTIRSERIRQGINKKPGANSGKSDPDSILSERLPNASDRSSSGFAFGERPLKPARMTDSRLTIAQTERAAGNEHASDSRKLKLNQYPVRKSV